MHASFLVLGPGLAAAGLVQRRYEWPQHVHACLPESLLPVPRQPAFKTNVAWPPTWHLGSMLGSSCYLAATALPQHLACPGCACVLKAWKLASVLHRLLRCDMLCRLEQLGCSVQVLLYTCKMASAVQSQLHSMFCIHR
eukprot:124204-Chlamydomonas_euryale.AAC.3